MFDHKPGQHDDLANAAAGALVLAAEAGGVGGALGVFEFFTAKAQAGYEIALAQKNKLFSGLRTFSGEFRAAVAEERAKGAPPSVVCAHPANLIVRMGNGQLRCSECGSNPAESAPPVAGCEHPPDLVRQTSPGRFHCGECGLDFGTKPPVTAYSRGRDGAPELRRK